MICVILGAGYGTRLRPLTLTTPKALIPLTPSGETILDYLFKSLNELQDLEEVILVSNNYYYERFVDFREKRGLDFEIINDGTNSEKERLGAIGDLSLAINKFNINTDILVLGSDNYFDFSLKEFVEFSKTKEIVMGLYDINDLEKAKNFGVAKIDSEYKIISLEEKPKNPQSALIAICIYYFSKNKIPLILKYSQYSSLESKDAPGSFFSKIYQSQKVYGFIFKGLWYDIGNYDSLEELRTLLQEVGR